MDNKDTEQEGLLWTQKEVGKALGVSTKTVSRHIAKGELPTVKIGRSIKVPKASVLVWMQAQTRYNVGCVGTMCASAGEKPCQSLNVVMEEVKTTTSMSKDHLEKRLNDLLELVTND